MPTITPFFKTDFDIELQFTDGTYRIIRFRQDQPVSSMLFTDSRELRSISVNSARWVLSREGPITRDNGLVLSARAALAVNSLKVYPNPCLNELKLADFSARSAQAEVQDATGRVVLRHSVAGAAPTLNTSTLAPGLYHLRLISPDGTVSGARFVRAAE